MVLKILLYGSIFIINILYVTVRSLIEIVYLSPGSLFRFCPKFSRQIHILTKFIFKATSVLKIFQGF